MIFRIIALIVCQAGIIATVLVFHSVPGWSQLGLDMKIVVGLIGSISFLLLALLILVPEERLVKQAHQTS